MGLGCICCALITWCLMCAPWADLVGFGVCSFGFVDIVVLIALVRLLAVY